MVVILKCCKFAKNNKMKKLIKKWFVWLFLERQKKDEDFYGYLLDCLYFHERYMYSSNFKSDYEYDIEMNREMQEQLKIKLNERD